MSEPGRRTGRTDPRQVLIESHLGLANHLARRFSDRGESREDLVQAAYLALVKAADRYDPSLGFEFSTYATRVILGELKHHFRDTGWAVRAPRQVQELYLEVNRAVSDLTHRLGRSPTVPEIAEACRRRPDEVLAAMEAGRAYRATSLETPTEGGTQLHDHLASRERPDTVLEDRSELWSYLQRLSPDDRELLRLRFVDELSQIEIAKRLGVSQMQVSRLLRRALDTLREAYRSGT